MFLVMKLACLAAYALGIAAWLGLVHGPLASMGAILAIALLGIHALELLYALKFLGRRRGPLAVSVVLALLFGVLHWGPLARQTRS